MANVGGRRRWPFPTARSAFPPGERPDGRKNVGIKAGAPATCRASTVAVLSRRFSETQNQTDAWKGLPDRSRQCSRPAMEKVEGELAL